MTKNISSVKILIIDNEATIRRSFTDYLEDRGFEVLTAENGRIGLELIEREQPQIALVDLLIPEMDGLEVLKRSRELAPDMPKIVICEANRAGDVVRDLRYGAWDYLIKPVKDLSILEHTIQNVLEKTHLIQENHDYRKRLEKLEKEQTKKPDQISDTVQENEKQLNKSRGMEAIGTLAGGIAHDLNNILSSILGYCQLAKMDIDDPEEIESHIDRIAKGSQRASELVQQILMNFCKNARHDLSDSGGTLSMGLTDIEIIPQNPSLGRAEKQTGKKSKQIMLVDDDENTLVIFQGILERQGYRVTTFKDGLSALQAFTKAPEGFDLVVTDMTMPQMTGAELSAGILKISKDMPIILCTGYSDIFTENMALKMGICKYVLKPVSGRNLSVMIRDLLDKKNRNISQQNTAGKKGQQ